MIISCYLAIRLAVSRSRKENMSKIDFVKEKDYFRDILKTYSAAELSYVDDFKIKKKREVVSTLLNLQLKNKIKIVDDKIHVLDSNPEGLRKTEKFILRSIKDGKVVIDLIGYMESYAQDEAIEDELIIQNSKETIIKRKNKMKNTLLILGIVLFALFWIISSSAGRINNMDGLAKSMVTILIIYFGLFILDIFIALPLYLFTYSLMQYNSFKRTEKGEEINEKLEGLRKYISEYTLLKDKDSKTIELWEEYLIYSVILDINKTKIVDNIMKMVEF